MTKAEEFYEELHFASVENDLQWFKTADRVKLAETLDYYIFENLRKAETAEHFETFKMLYSEYAAASNVVRDQVGIFAEALETESLELFQHLCTFETQPKVIAFLLDKVLDESLFEALKFLVEKTSFTIDLASCADHLEMSRYLPRTPLLDYLADLGAITSCITLEMYRESLNTLARNKSKTRAV